MIGALIVTHGGLAAEFLRAAQTIEPGLGGVRALVLDWNENPDRASETVGTTIREMDTGEGVVVLTDMFGGTPSNVSLPFLEEGRVEIVTGVNLPMVVKLSLRDQRGMTLHDLARQLRDKGRKSIEVASEVLSEHERVAAARGPK